MKSANIPHLYSRNGIYYYRNNSVWKSLRTRCKREAFLKLTQLFCGTYSSVDKSPSPLGLNADAFTSATSAAVDPVPKVASLLKSYLHENSSRWSERECTRVEGAFKFLPKSGITKAKAIEVKQKILAEKTVATFNRYLKYFNAFYRWLIANSPDIIVNPFDGLKVVEKKRGVSSLRKAYTPEQLEVLMKFTNQFSKDDKRYWLIMIGRYTGARMNEICQLKPEDITVDAIHIRGEVLKTCNAKRSIPTHPRLIELGLLDWVGKCIKERLFHEWRPVRGSYSHAGSRWFSRNNPFKSKVKGERAEVDFHSIRHTVATEMKQAGIASHYAAQILGHSNGNITYDRYGKDVCSSLLMNAIRKIGK